MMNFKTFALSTLVLSSLALSSCGGGGGQPITAASAQKVLGTLNKNLKALPRTNAMPSLPDPRTAGLVSLVPPACETSEPAVPTDLDLDSIQTYKKYTYNCSEDVSNGSSYSYAGTTEVRDLDESGPQRNGLFGGLRVDFNIPSSVYKTVGTEVTHEHSHVGHWLYTNSNGSLISDSSYTGKNKYSYDGLHNDYSYMYTWNSKMTPVDSALPWTSGSFDIKGSFALSGKYIGEVDGKHAQAEGTWVVNYSSKDLLYQFAGVAGSCSEYYKSGSIFVDDGSKTVEFRYFCNSMKIFVNNVESDWTI